MYKMFEEEGYYVFMTIHHLNDLEPDKYEVGVYGIEIGKIDVGNMEIIDSKLFIHPTNTTKEDCQKKIDSLRIKYQDDLPTV